jgi:ankyrin repeat protein
VLLRSGADPNARSAVQQAPSLHLAVTAGGNGNTLRLLLEYGADPTVVYAGHTALEMARLTDNHAAVQILQESAAGISRTSLSGISH